MAGRSDLSNSMYLMQLYAGAERKKRLVLPPEIAAPSLKEAQLIPNPPAELLCGSYTRMPSEPLPNLPSEEDPLASNSSDEAELPGELSEFNQRLASFGLGEAPDPLLTDARPPAKRRQS
jgi:hypothetical protein